MGMTADYAGYTTGVQDICNMCQSMKRDDIIHTTKECSNSIITTWRQQMDHKIHTITKNNPLLNNWEQISHKQQILILMATPSNIPKVQQSLITKSFLLFFDKVTTYRQLFKGEHGNTST